MSKRKLIAQRSHQEEGVVGRVCVYVAESGNVWFSANFFKDTEPQWKATMRQTDRVWVAKNIPSSIWWDLEIHHDWENGGVMYLLTHLEHKLLERKIKEVKKQKNE